MDSKNPPGNLALMQIASYYKSRGHTIGFDIKSPDKVYMSCILSKNREKTLLKSQEYNCEVYIGGSGINYDWLPEEMQMVKPDYDLYPSEYSLGFTTRGCIRNCKFCIVREKEGRLHRWQHIKDFHDDRFDTVILLDNNILADKEWFFKNSDYLIENELGLIENGMDIRLLDNEIAEQLSKIKFKKPMKFAFDNMNDEDSVLNGIEMLKRNGINIRNNVQFYVLVGYNTTMEEDKYRCRLLKKLNTNAFVMPYKKDWWTKKIARWGNRKWLYWSCDIDDYVYGRNSKNRRKLEGFF